MIEETEQEANASFRIDLKIEDFRVKKQTLNQVQGDNKQNKGLQPLVLLTHPLAMAG